MSTNFNTGTTSGQSGVLGSRLQRLGKWQKQDSYVLGGKVSFNDYLITQGFNTKKVYGTLEKDLGYSSGSLSMARSVCSNDDSNEILFQDANGSFAQINFDDFKYEIKSERQVTSAFTDWTNGRPYDAYKVDQGGFTFYQLFNTGSGDGSRDSIYIDRIKNDLFKWGLTTVVQTEYGGYA